MTHVKRKLKTPLLQPILLGDREWGRSKPLAPFVQELTNEIQAQLQQLDRSLTRAAAVSDHEYRARRYKIFHDGLQAFGDSFSTHKLFIDAIAEEHDIYVTFLRDQIEQYERDRDAAVQEFDRMKTRLQEEKSTWDCEFETAKKELRQERHQLEQSKKAHLEAMTREKAALPDANRKVQDLQTRVLLLSKENENLAAENARLRRLNENLSIQTFSDALQSSMEELRQTRDTLLERDEQLSDAMDSVEDLSRDLTKLCEAFTREVRRAPKKSELRLTQRGLDKLKGMMID